jgi:hypothetical protein
MWGDLPYSDLQATTGVPNLIADMNDSDIEFSVHNGDLKAGGIPGSITPTTCSDALYEQTRGYLNALKRPAMLTPGDNDWTDCDRPANGGFNSLERLDHERTVFFSTHSRWVGTPSGRKSSRRRCAWASTDRRHASRIGAGPSGM